MSSPRPWVTTKLGSMSPLRTRSYSGLRERWTWHWPVRTIRPLFMSAPTGNFSISRVLRDLRHRARRADAADEGGRRRAPVRQRRAGGRDRGARRPGARGRRAGGGTTTDAGRPGALGTAATFSFFPSENLGCFGDGGAITTSDDAIAE